jgi:glutamate-ammonia-ligase adenylyltransferase
MTEISHDGVLYEVDARLRPEGKNAPLVTDFSAYVKYLSSRASLWERQSLTRLRFVWGDEDLASEVHDAVTKFVYESPLSDDWAQSIVVMRKAMETRSRTSRGSYLDLKLGPGGMVDVEFLAQMTQLLGGTKDANHRRRRTTAEILEMIPAELLSEDAARGLVRTYRFFRDVEKLMRLTLEEKNTLLPDDEKLETLARCQSGIKGDDMKELIAASMRDVRQQFLAVSERMSRAEF